MFLTSKIAVTAGWGSPPIWGTMKPALSTGPLSWTPRTMLVSPKPGANGCSAEAARIVRLVG